LLSGSPQLAAKIALEIGGAASLNAGDDELRDTRVSEAQFQARVQLLYDAATDGGRIVLNASRLRDYVYLLGIRGADEAQVVDIELCVMQGAFDALGSACMQVSFVNHVVRDWAQVFNM